MSGKAVHKIRGPEASDRGVWAGAWADLRQGLSELDLVLLLLRHANRRRYHRVAGGMAWVTASMVAWMFGLGMVSAAIFERDALAHVPYVGLGIGVWFVVATLVSGGASVFLNSSHLSRQIPLPYSIFVFTHVVGALEQLVLRLPVILILVAVHPDGDFAGLPLAALAVLLLGLSGVGISLGLGVVAARVRLLKELVEVSMNFFLFMSATFWYASQLEDRVWILYLNPFYHAIEAIRGPLIGVGEPLLHLGVLAVGAVICNLVGFALFALMRRRLAYWVAA